MSSPALVYPRRFASLVKIEHTLFALPFAYVGAFLAVGGAPSAHDLVWITVAMVGARSFAMGLNRLIDAAIDARNPRTAMRELPAGRLRRGQVLAFCLVSLAIFLVAVFQLAHVVRYLWPVVVVPMVVYPYLKRVTPLCHLWLGLVDGLAPVGAWIAVTGQLELAPWLVCFGLAFWMAGFDVIYATLDVEVDRAQGLHSLPADLGIARALTCTRVFHVLAVVLLAAVGPVLGLGPVYYVGVAAVGALLLYENSLVHADDLSRVDAAFFSVNGIISVTYLAAVVLDAALS
jgi:4-hydroxybenzoate polyprenyltransferase